MGKLQTIFHNELVKVVDSYAKEWANSDEWIKILYQQGLLHDTLESYVQAECNPTMNKGYHLFSLIFSNDDLTSEDKISNFFQKRYSSVKILSDSNVTTIVYIYKQRTINKLTQELATLNKENSTRNIQTEILKSLLTHNLSVQELVDFYEGNIGIDSLLDKVRLHTETINQDMFKSVFTNYLIDESKKLAEYNEWSYELYTHGYFSKDLNRFFAEEINVAFSDFVNLSKENPENYQFNHEDIKTYLKENYDSNYIRLKTNWVETLQNISNEMIAQLQISLAQYDNSKSINNWALYISQSLGAGTLRIKDIIEYYENKVDIEIILEKLILH